MPTTDKTQRITYNDFENMTATAFDLSAIRTDATTYAGTFRTLIGVYSASEVDALLAGLDGLTAEDIDTLAEINAILTDANLASIAYVDGLAANYATAAQGTKADTALQPSDITSGTITAGTGDIDFDNLGGGAESPLTLTASTATETPLTVQATASQSVPIQTWKNSAGTTLGQISKEGWIFIGGGSAPAYPLDVNGRIRCTDRLVMGGSVNVISRDGTGYTVVDSNLGTIIQGGRAFSANTTGAFIRIDPGASTGTGTPATVKVRRTTPTGSGTGLQTLSDGIEIDGNTTSGETPLLLLDIDKGTLQRVSIGTADSGGTGFKVLRVPN